MANPRLYQDMIKCMLLYTEKSETTLPFLHRLSKKREIFTGFRKKRRFIFTAFRCVPAAALSPSG